MKIFHISGAPGSGKTTIGTRLARDGRVAVIETDDLLSPDNEAGQALHRLERSTASIEEYREAWAKIFRREIDGAIDRESQRRDVCAVVLVGVLSHYGAQSTLDISDLVDARHRFFVDVPLKILLKRFYSRLAQNDDLFWERIASGVWNIPGDVDYKKEVADALEWHRANGYTFMDNDAVEAAVMTMLPGVPRCARCGRKKRQ